MSKIGLKIPSSKFRHVYGDPFKKDNCFDNVRIAKSAWDSPLSAVNEKFVAAVLDTTGGAFSVFKHSQHGRQKVDFPKFADHKGAILDLAFNPFNANIIASCSEDCTVKVWQIPEHDLKEDLQTPLMTFDKHGRKVGQLLWHPTAENILFSVSFDLTIRTWNVATGEEVNCFSVHPDVLFSLAINEDGSKFVTTCKDKKLRIIDSHTGTVDHEFVASESVKSFKSVFVSKNRLVVASFSRRNERELKVFSLENDFELLATQEIDSSSGAMTLHYDADLDIIYVVGKGDTSIRYYSILPEAPHIMFLSAYTSSAPQRGVCWLPKRAVNTATCEIARGYKLHVKDMIEPISFIVPRKSDAFQEDIFPDTQGDEPSMTADEFIAGKNAGPKKISLAEGFASKTKAFTAPEIKADVKSAPNGEPKDEKELREAYRKLKQVVADLEKQINTKDVTIRQLELKLQQFDLEPPLSD